MILIWELTYSDICFGKFTGEHGEQFYILLFITEFEFGTGLEIPLGGGGAMAKWRI